MNKRDLEYGYNLFKQVAKSINKTNIDNKKEPKKFNKYVAYAMLFANFTVFRRMSYTLFKNMFYIIICIGISTLVIGYKKKRGEEHE